MDPGRVIQKDVWLEILSRPRLGKLEGFLVGKRNGEAIGGAEGGVVRQPERGCHLVKRTDPGLVNV